MFALQSLNARLLVRTHHPHPLLMESLSLSIKLADSACFLIERFRVFSSAVVQPIARQVWL
jgi:hypothetical protein